MHQLTLLRIFLQRYCMGNDFFSLEAKTIECMHPLSRIDTAPCGMPLLKPIEMGCARSGSTDLLTLR
jgi:hypothetical protein